VGRRWLFLCFKDGSTGAPRRVEHLYGRIGVSGSWSVLIAFSELPKTGEALCSPGA